MSLRRPWACAEPGPRGMHCTEDPGHPYSCYDGGEDASWNDDAPHGWQDRSPHACSDPECQP